VHVGVEQLAPFLSILTEPRWPLVRRADVFEHGYYLSRLIDDPNEPLDNRIVLQHKLERRVQSDPAVGFFRVRFRWGEDANIRPDPAVGIFRFHATRSSERATKSSGSR
jgi:hypothetical protein